MIDDIKTFGLWKTIKYAWQRAFRGYDDTFSWEMDTYLNYYFVPEIKKFCERRIKECGDERFLKVYKTMLEKIDNWEKENEDYGKRLGNWYKNPNANSEMWEFFGGNISYFWD